MLAALPGSFVIHYGQTADPAAMDALLGFLGSTGRFADTSSEYRKQYDGSLREAFANWDELEATLPGLPPLAAIPAPDPRPLPAGKIARLTDGPLATTCPVEGVRGRPIRSAGLRNAAPPDAEGMEPALRVTYRVAAGRHRKLHEHLRGSSPSSATSPAASRMRPVRPPASR